MKPIYFDNNATTCIAPEVRDAMMPFFNELYGNPSSMHMFGGQVAKHVQHARERVAAFLNADPTEIIFTSCGTESDNMAIHGTAELLGPQSKVITSRVEHPAVLGPCRRLKNMGHRAIELPVDTSGQIDLEALRDALKDGTPAIVSLMWANNETGVIFPMEKIVEIAKEAGAIIHTDAVQAAGKLPIDVKRVPVDMLSISGHKLHAPKGIGIFYLRRGTRLKTFMLGGHQESGRRGGTENVPYIVGLGKAVDLAAAYMDEERRTLARLRDKLENGLLATCPDARVNGDRMNRLPNTTNISFEYIEGEAILYHLSDLGICASTGSACATGSLEPSHVIRAMGVPFTAVHGSVRFSLSRYNTEAEVDTVLEHMPRVVRKLRDLSPFGKGDTLPVEL
ncbi:MAG: cysteine desulfurase NifS [Kiritimatiellae bacterium]|jgi:cysteine desulfurase|nr:cysteine desulfurase NifS [Kiritimatiellia bacterium]MDD2349275.1 cysteine desulfurase NifS [Kiritimatiellia bacterium]HON47042.1 cysteine desulfurase NifS [Kiritimatiellia bacterium]